MAGQTKLARTASANKQGLRQAMTPVHTWLGLLAGWLLYAMFLTGAVSYFKDEISLWMRPELPVRAIAPDAAHIDRMAAALAREAPGATQWSITLPTQQRTSVATAFWRLPTDGGTRERFGMAELDMATGQLLERSARATRGGDFFYRFHFQFHYIPAVWGRWLAGLCAMFMLVAIVTGVIIHKKIFADFFTFRWGKGQRSWWDAHNALSVFGLPFHAMIAYTGLVTMMVMYMPWGRDAAMPDAAAKQAFDARMFLFAPPGPAAGTAAPLASLDKMVAQARQRWGSVGGVTVDNPGDVHARVFVLRGNGNRPSISPHWMLFDGTTGALLQVQEDVGAAAETRGVLYALHLGRFGDLPTRWLYFLTSLTGTAMVGTGLVLWTSKRRTRLADPARPHPGFALVERLNVVTIAGLPCGMAGMLWANRLLPEAWPARAAWEIHAMFIVWGAVAVWAFVRPVRRAWAEGLLAAAVLIGALPLLNALTTQRGLAASLAAGDWVFVGMDLTLLALALLHAALAWRVLRHRTPPAPARARSARAASPGSRSAPEAMP